MASADGLEVKIADLPEVRHVIETQQKLLQRWVEIWESPVFVAEEIFEALMKETREALKS